MSRGLGDPFKVSSHLRVARHAEEDRSLCVMGMTVHIECGQQLAAWLGHVANWLLNFCHAYKDSVSSCHLRPNTFCCRASSMTFFSHRTWSDSNYKTKGTYIWAFWLQKWKRGKENDYWQKLESNQCCIVTKHLAMCSIHGATTLCTTC